MDIFGRIGIVQYRIEAEDIIDAGKQLSFAVDDLLFRNFDMVGLGETIAERFGAIDFVANEEDYSIDDVDEFVELHHITDEELIDALKDLQLYSQDFFMSISGSSYHGFAYIDNKFAFVHIKDKFYCLTDDYLPDFRTSIMDMIDWACYKGKWADWPPKDWLKYAEEIDQESVNAYEVENPEF